MVPGIYRERSRDMDSDLLLRDELKSFSRRTVGRNLNREASIFPFQHRCCLRLHIRGSAFPGIGDR